VVHTDLPDLTCRRKWLSESRLGQMTALARACEEFMRVVEDARSLNQRGAAVHTLSKVK
jgi:hypothetical protein